MPLDRRPLRSELQRARGFVPPSQRIQGTGSSSSSSSAAAGATLCMHWMSGEEAVRLTLPADGTVSQLKRRLQTVLSRQYGDCRYQLLGLGSLGLLRDSSTMQSLGLAGCTSTLQLIAD